MLVDWCISRTKNDEALGCCVAAYADKRVFRTKRAPCRTS